MKMEYGDQSKHRLYRGDGMDRLNTVPETAMGDLELEIMLLVNERLFQKGNITEEMCMRAKELILKS